MNQNHDAHDDRPHLPAEPDLANFLGDMKLSPQEIETALLILSGKTRKQTAHLLNVTLNTVRTYRDRVLEKAGVKTPMELAGKIIHNLQQGKSLRTHYVTSQ